MKALKDLGIVIDGVRQPRPADRETQGRKGIWAAAQCSTRAAADYRAAPMVVLTAVRSSSVVKGFGRAVMPGARTSYRWTRSPA